MSSSTAVILFCHNRPLYLARTLRSLQRARRSSPEEVDLIISQDGDHRGVKLVVQMFGHTITHTYQSNFSPPAPKVQGKLRRRIAAHYGWGLSQVFDELGYDRVIIVEDDMEFAPDFFFLFPCISAPASD